ncbi:MAG: hypothetical protein JWM86_1497 [Thermoleophilia bacterium]|nr:hypothetical protein [Thermoleophilia bacterium]
MRITLPRALPVTELDDVERVLAHGVEVLGSRAQLGEVGTNGAMQTLRLQLPGGGRVVEALNVPPFAQAAQEDFISQVARRLGVEHLFTPTMVRPDGSAMVALGAGKPAESVGATSAADLHAALTGLYERELPQLGRAGAAEQARVDLELGHVIDSIVANSDRHGSNILLDAKSGAVTLIDIGNMGTPGRRTLRPMLNPQYLLGARDGAVELHPRTVEILRENLTPADLRQLQGHLRATLADYPGGAGGSLENRGRQHLLKRVLSRDTFADDMVARRERILATGRVEYTDARLNEILATTWLRAYGTAAASGVAGMAAAGTGAALLARD